MAISADLGTHLETYVNELVTKGRYNSKSEVLREGVRMLLGGQFFNVVAPLVGSFSMGEVSISKWRTAVISITVLVMVA